MRNRRRRMRRGPLVVYEKDDGIVRAFRNIPGVELCCVTRMNLLQMAPGGHVGMYILFWQSYLGRFVIWTEAAFKQLEQLYGSVSKPATAKHGYTVPRAVMTNSDLARIINSDEIQSVIKAAAPKHAVKKLPRTRLDKKMKITQH